MDNFVWPADDVINIQMAEKPFPLPSSIVSLGTSQLELGPQCYSVSSVSMWHLTLWGLPIWPLSLS